MGACLHRTFQALHGWVLGGGPTDWLAAWFWVAEWGMGCGCCGLLGLEPSRLHGSCTLHCIEGRGWGVVQTMSSWWRNGWLLLRWEAKD